MTDTIKILLLPKELKCTWDITELKQRLEPFDKFRRRRFNPLGFVRGTFSVTGNNNCLVIEGSLAKYFNGNNVDNFDWKFVKPAIKMLSHELGLPIERGTLLRIDTACNIELDQPVPEYFPELNYLRFYQRIHNRETTLRFMSNQENIQLLFYDKLAEIGSKNYRDKEIGEILGYKNLLRYEVQIQERAAKALGMRKIKTVHLYSTSFYKKLLDDWYSKYCDIEKRALMVFPSKMKGRKDVDRFIYRYYVEHLGWTGIEAMFNNALKNGSLTADDKSKKLKQLREVMSDNTKFDFKNIILELNEKVAEMYLENYNQIHRIIKKQF
ncbi:phage/plasmid replication domain-containing protein [Ferruginibacter sp.]